MRAKIWYRQYQFIGSPTMRLLASTDFALRVLMRLAAEPADAHMSVEALARELGGL